MRTWSSARIWIRRWRCRGLPCTGRCGVIRAWRRRRGGGSSVPAGLRPGCGLPSCGPIRRPVRAQRPGRPPASSLAAFEPSLHFVDFIHALDDDAGGRGGGLRPRGRRPERPGGALSALKSPGGSGQTAPAAEELSPGPPAEDMTCTDCREAALRPRAIATSAGGRPSRCGTAPASPSVSMPPAARTPPSTA